MLQSIYAIGREISQGRDPWLDIVAKPYIDKIKDEGKSLYTLELNFNLDNGEVETSPDDLAEFTDEKNTLVKWACIPVQPANHNAFYVAMDAQKLEFLSKSFFGKPVREDEGYPEGGQFLKAIRKTAPEVESMLLGQVLKKIPLCRNSFLAKLMNEKGDLDVKKLVADFFKTSEGEKKKTEIERIVLVISSVTSLELNLEKYPIRDLEGYDIFIEKHFKFKKDAKKTNASRSKKRLCYASGELSDEVTEADFSGRDNLTSLFVKTTMNYATGFQKNAYHQNYQVSAEIGKFLERGAIFLSQEQTCSIAGIRHVIVPQFFRQDNYSVEGYLKPLKLQSDLFFKSSELSKLENYLANQVNEGIPEIYWLNFVATDVIAGKSLKVSSLIKDVSKFHFRQLLETFAEVGDLLTPWLGGRYGFNFNTMYQVIPVRDGKKEKKNNALALFAAMLEQRRIDESQLFRDFSQYVRCHWFDQFDNKGKHRAFPNIKTNPKQENPQKKFDYEVKDGVFKYLAFWRALRQLNLLIETQTVMQEEKKLTAEEIAASEETFCDGLRYSDAQKAMFYLGRVLNSIVYEQSGVRRHKKNALDKLNYNGMDAKALVRLSEDLFEASRHYNITSKIVWSWGKFSGLFNPDTWKLNSQESLFFILSGYTWGIRSKKGEETGLLDTENEPETSDND
jgi:CRISPR-associated protein Csh1